MADALNMVAGAGVGKVREREVDAEAFGLSNQVDSDISD